MQLIEEYRSRCVAAENPLVARENGQPVGRHAVTRYRNKAGVAAGLPQLRSRCNSEFWLSAAKRGRAAANEGTSRTLK